MGYFRNYVFQPDNKYYSHAQMYRTNAFRIIPANPQVNPYYVPFGQPIMIPVTPQTQQNSRCISEAELQYRNDNRSLWEEHVAWTRMAIISLIFNLPDIDEVLTRLLKNATDMGNMIRKLYGDTVATTYGDLIKEHLLIAADLVKASLAGNMEEAQKAEQKWYQNADEIAVFLNSVNPYLTVSAVKEMFYKHLDLTKQEAVFMMNKEYKKDILVYDEIEKLAREMADTISDAMIKHYPSIF